MLPYFSQGHPSTLQRRRRHAHHWGRPIVDPLSRPEVGHGVSPLPLAKAQQEQEEEQQEHRCSQEEEDESRPRLGDLEHPREESVK